MPLSVKDHVDFIAKCDERLRQNWLGPVTLTYGIPALVATRKDQNCFIGEADLKEWIVCIYPVFAIFFVFGLWQNFRERRSWMASALGLEEARVELPELLKAQWERSLTDSGRVVREVWLAFRIAVVLISGEYGIVAICDNPKKGWFGNSIANLSGQGWHLAWQIPLAVAAVVLLGYLVLRLFSYLGRREATRPV